MSQKDLDQGVDALASEGVGLTAPVGSELGEAALDEVVQPVGADEAIDDVVAEPAGEETSIVDDVGDGVVSAILIERESSIVDKRLLSNSGIVEVAREFGVKFDVGELSDTTVAAFLKACAETPALAESGLLLFALSFVAYGQVFVSTNRLPEHVNNDQEDPIQAYLGALEFVDNWLDAHKQKADLPKGSAGKFFDRRFKEDWNRAMKAAVAVRDGAVQVLKDNDGKEIVLGGPTDTSMHLYDSKGNPLVNFRTFLAERSTVGEDKDLQNRKVPGGKGSVGFDFDSMIKGFGELRPVPEQPLREDVAPDSFRALILPLSEYPDRSVIDAAIVEHVVGVVPLASDREESLFRVSFNGGEKPFMIEILTGEDWHTRNRKLVDPEGGMLSLGLPSRVGRGEEFFSARSGSLIGPKQEARAAENGDAVAKSIVLVVKPVVEEYRAKVRAGVAKYRTGRITAGGMAQLLVENQQDNSNDPKAKDSIMALLQAGHINQQQAQDVIDMLPITRQAVQDERDAQFRSMASFRDDSLTRGGGMLSFGGPTRGGGLGFGESMHTGSSGVGTGQQYGTLSQKLTVDPLSSPKIIVLRPFGIRATENIEEVAAGLADVVSLKDRKRTA